MIRYCSISLVRMKGGGGDVLEGNDDGGYAEEDEGEETVSEYGGCTIRIDTTLTHQIQQCINRR